MFLTVITLIGAYPGLGVADGPGGYVVTPAAVSGDDPGIVARDAPAVSYWSLPLWVQVAAIADGLLIAAGLAGAAPAILGRIQDMLDNPTRHSIFNYVLGNPGCTPAEITARQRMKHGTVKYHLQMLEAEGMIVLRRMGKFTRLFRSSSGNSDLERTVASYMRNETSGKLLKTIGENPGVTNQWLAETFRLDKSSVHWHIERFLRDNLVWFEQSGRFKKYYLDEEARAAVAKFHVSDVPQASRKGVTA
jgi:predicted transcriptional regulator